MANKKISELDVAASITGAELLPVVQSSNTKQTSVNDIGVLTKKISLTSSQVLTLNTSPVTLIAAPGAGKFIQALVVSGNLTFSGATSYSGGNVLQVYFNSGYDIFLNGMSGMSGLLLAISNAFQSFRPYATSSDVSDIAVNSPLMLSVQGADPTGGTSTLDVYVTYRVVSL